MGNWAIGTARIYDFNRISC